MSLTNGVKRVAVEPDPLGAESSKHAVKEFWDEAACGEELLLSGHRQEDYSRQADDRYALEPFIAAFAEFESSAGLRVLEIGVGLGADHERFARSGAELFGVDLTARAIDHTRRRLRAVGLRSILQVADAEHLPFTSESFDVVYSWGVIHHTPDTRAAVREIHRVLRDGGEARVMIYHKWSLVGLMLWVRYALLGGRPWMSLEEIYGQYLESPGTKAYSKRDAQALFSIFTRADIETVLTHGDLLSSAAGQRHRGRILRLARAIWPRRMLRLLVPRAGLFMLVRARK